MSLLTAEQILNQRELPYEDVPVPEWNGTIRIKTMTGQERDDFEVRIQGGGSKVEMTNIRAKLVAACAVDEQSQRIFNDSQVEALGRTSAKALDRAFEVASRLNGFSNKDVEDLAKNSETRGGDGGSTSA